MQSSQQNEHGNADAPKEIYPVANRDAEATERPDQKPLYHKSAGDVQNQHLKKMLAVQQSKTGMTKKQ